MNRVAVGEAFNKMSPNEMKAVLAMRLTLIEHTRELGTDKRKEMIDALLGEVANIRQDSEYRLYVEGVNIPECRERIETCNLTLARLGKILGV